MTDSSSGVSDTMTVTITVTGANDAPEAGADQTGAVTEDATTSTVTGTVAPTDIDADNTGFTYSVGSATGTYGSMAMSGASWTYTLDNSDADTTALDAGDTVTDAFTITVTDGSGGTDTMTVTVTVTGADDATSAGADQTGAVTEDAQTTTSTGTVAGVDDDADSSLSYAVGTSAGTYGSMAMSGASWTYTLDNSTLTPQHWTLETP